MKILSSSISTTIFSRAYLERAWKDRSTLAEYERNGFAIAFYITVTGHVEATLVELIERRLMYTRSVIAQHKEGKFSWAGAKDAPEYSTLPIHGTLMSLVGNFSHKIDSAPFSSLTQLFQTVFDVQLNSLLGDNNKDLEAIMKLRNIFAHGRELWLRFNHDEKNLMSLDENPLQLPAQRLLAAKIITTLQFDAWTHQDFQRVFFSDAALLYFLHKAQEIENKFKSLLTFAPEQEMTLIVSLPDLYE